MFTNSGMPTPLSPEDQKQLEEAVHRLEKTSLAMRIADKIGRPIEYGLKRLPAAGRELIQRAARTANTPWELFSVLANELPEGPERDRFLAAQPDV